MNHSGIVEIGNYIHNFNTWRFWHHNNPTKIGQFRIIEDNKTWEYKYFNDNWNTIIEEDAILLDIEYTKFLNRDPIETALIDMGYTI